MTDSAAIAAHWAMLATAFLLAWLVLGLLVALLYGQLCRLADQRTREVEEMRNLLTTLGRIRQEEHHARMIDNVEAMVLDVRFARQTERLARDVRRARLVSVEDVDQLPEVG